MAHGRPNMRCSMRGRARDTVWLLAALPSANLLPVAKFVSNGFLINQLGQVDLRLAPQNIRQSVSLPPPSHTAPHVRTDSGRREGNMKESPHDEERF